MFPFFPSAPCGVLLVDAEVLATSEKRAVALPGLNRGKREKRLVGEFALKGIEGAGYVEGTALFSEGWGARIDERPIEIPARPASPARDALGTGRTRR